MNISNHSNIFAEAIILELFYISYESNEYIC